MISQAASHILLSQTVSPTPEHLFYMRRCLQLAALGRGWVEPNPMVGCVIVANGEVVAEGYHARYGEAHAEARAIASVADSSLLSACTLYVSLEPCAHFGKTPPCADLIIRSGIRNVVIGSVDPNPKVDGGGIRKLQEAGCNVIWGVMEQECRDLNARFFSRHEKKRPYILLKWAQTADGFMGRLPVPGQKPAPFWISSASERRWTHKWRAEEQAILVGTGTAIADNPSLTVRDWSGKNPLRIVFDRKLVIPPDASLFTHDAPTWVVTEQSEAPLSHVRYLQVKPGTDFWPPLLEALQTEKILSIMVEGGAETHARLLALQLWDEARIFISHSTLGQGVLAPTLQGTPASMVETETGILLVYRNPLQNRPFSNR